MQKYWIKEEWNEDNKKRIYYDDQGYYNEDAVLMEGGLNYCDELSEDEQSLAEYWQNH